MKTLLVLTTALVLATQSGVGAVDHPELKAYPPAEEGMERFVIVLPNKSRDEEGGFKVEIIVGKEVLTDDVNKYFLGNTIEEKVVKDWGFPYYEVTGSGQVGSTLIGVPPGTPPVQKLVTAQPKLVRYNSRLPIVVYAPKGYVVQYNVWTRGEKTKPADKG